MNKKIGFVYEEERIPQERKKDTLTTPAETDAIRPSLVEIRFSGVHKPYSYYNDKFYLKPGDRVFVEGKLEGQQGIVMRVSYNFKIKLSDYKRVVSKAELDIYGDFFPVQGRVYAFNPETLPYEKVMTWFKPVTENKEIAVFTDESHFNLDTFEGLEADKDSVAKGHELYMEDAVAYIELKGKQGRAIVEGSRYYELEFQYENGEISSFFCECYNMGVCRHQVAMLFELRDALKVIEEKLFTEYERSGYFASICKHIFLDFVIASKNDGKIIL